MKKIFVLLISGLSFFACSENAEESGISGNFEKAPLQIAMRYTETSHFDSLVLHGEGADTLHLRIEEPEKTLDLELFPSLWKFYAKLYAEGVLMQKGESEIEVKSGEKNYLQIPLQALFGFIDITLPLGLDNPSGILSGKLDLKTDDTTYSYTMKIEEPYGIFSTDALPLEKTYHALLQLFDKNGDCIFKASDSLRLDSENAIQEWELESLKGALTITFLTDILQTHSIQANLPSGHLRVPKAGEILISEILPIPEQTGTDYEFVEIYNGTNDSLQLENCELHGGSPKVASLPSSILIAPNSFVAIGADSAIGVQFHTETKWPSLTNTKQSVVLRCNGITIDSLFYGQADSLDVDFLPVKSGVSTQLILSSWKEKESSSAWCVSDPTPGIENNCSTKEGFMN
jgi:hypothetical protein